ncbi:CopD family protein [Isoalcanivorax indicus]|uniref:CopD family protein n=1 Tax=Isoalcanivorax indicus TaxID=2202653 RepID=UPI000DB982C4|nr:CopD family protein [Isoalcanivorax indicus]
MPWIKILHIATLSLWCGALLYLPALIHSCGRVCQTGDATSPVLPRALPRSVYTLFATPVALLAIISGSLLFTGVVDPQADSPALPLWLLAKLLLVAGMVVCHALNGWLIQRHEAGDLRAMALLCHALMAVSALLIVGVLWLVLATPL